MQQPRTATPDLVRLFDDGTTGGLTEWELLERFVSRGDSLAFEALVARLGPMVLGTCRPLLLHPDDVDDAFQATFLVLLRRARTLGPADAIGAWLHGVAVRVAMRARSDTARRERHERLGIAAEWAEVSPVKRDPEIGRILDEEINRLPPKYKAPIVLCYLEGRTHEEAARQLCWPVGSVKGRLARARSLLASRLTRRGVASSAGALSLVLFPGTRSEAAVPAPLLESTCRAATQISAGKLPGLVVSTSIAGLLRGVLTTMMLEKVKLLIPLLIVSGAVLSGAGVMARQQAGRPAEGPRERAQRPTPLNVASHTADDVRKPVVQTIGRRKSVPTRTEDLYRELVEAARGAYLASAEEMRAGRGSLLRVYQASRQILDAQRNEAKSPEETSRAIEAHIDRIRSLENRFELGSTDRAEAVAILAEAQLWLAQAKDAGKEVREARKPSPTKPDDFVPAPGSKPGKDVRSRTVLMKLDMPVAMSFPNETPLEDVLKYLKQATTGPADAGIPIYVDPLGLQKANIAMTSGVMIDLEGIPLRRSLQLVLSQLGLVYFVDDGILCITNEGSQTTSFEPSMREPTPLVEKQARARRGELTVEEMKELIEKVKLLKELERAERSSPE